jgi:5-formyltetrahydrofolate cyclo-ligase
MAKQALRGRVLAERDDLPAAARVADSQAIRARLQALPSLAVAQTVLLTLPFRSEWDTRPLAEDALRAGKRIVVPRVDRVARMLRLHSVADLDVDIVAGYLGIPEPRETLPIVDPGAVDWVLVPGVAFDAAGRRLGYGGGFYDRLLPLVRADAPRVAGAFEVQIVDEVPASSHDRRVDAVISPTRMLFPGG